MAEHLIKDIEFVECDFCKKHFEKLDNRHLKKHNITLIEYRQKFPNSPTKTKERYTKDLVDNEKRQKARKEKPQFVKRKCWNFKNCGNEVDNVNINIGKISVICNECKEKNLFHPKVIEHKNRMSEQAKELNKNSDVIKKRTKTLRNRTPEEIKQFKNKRENTLIEKDGEEWKQIQYEKTKAGMIRIHGDEHALNIDKFIEKAQNTHFRKTGYVHYMDDPKNVKKVFESRGPKQKEITKKTVETNIERYGGSGPMCDPSIINKANKTRLKGFLPKLYLFLEKVNLKLLDEYEDAYAYNKYQCLKCKTVFESNWNQIQQGRDCPSCNNKFKPSKAENEIYTYLQSLGITNISRNDRHLIKPYEIDLLLQDQKLGIEHCGLYTHREDVLRRTRKKMNDIRTYHCYKLDQCQKQGYQLLTIFEDEWLFKQDIVKAMLKQRVGKNNNEQIYARNCEIYEITFETKRDFLKEFHIQGNDNSQIMLGAFSKEGDRLVAIMTFSKPSIAKGSGIQTKGHWELNRFCTDYNFRVPGVAGKLLSHFKKNFEWVHIYSFADRRWSSGNLYHQLGFTLTTDVLKIKPNYWYVDCNKLQRLHRFGLRKTKDDPKDMTEQMLRVSQGYKLIYDCGNLKFTLDK